MLGGLLAFNIVEFMKENVGLQQRAGLVKFDLIYQDRSLGYITHRSLLTHWDNDGGRKRHDQSRIRHLPSALNRLYCLFHPIPQTETPQRQPVASGPPRALSSFSVSPMSLDQPTSRRTLLSLERSEELSHSEHSEHCDG